MDLDEKLIHILDDMVLELHMGADEELLKKRVQAKIRRAFEGDPENEGGLDAPVPS